jgi:hypothetical protein
VGTEVRRRVGVAPRDAFESGKPLLAALQEVFPVAFEARAADDCAGLDGLLILDPTALADGSVRTLVLCSPALSEPRRAPVEFAAGELVERPLRGRSLREEDGRAGLAGVIAEYDTALATVAREAVWWRRAGAGPGIEVSVFSPPELRAGETLREHLRPGRFMGLVPLLHFLRDVCGERDWLARPLRASFVVDDPNLHRPSYGFLDYAELIAQAARRGYHVGLAMVPLDGWLVSRRAASLLRSNGDQLSLLVHGNDHTARELGRLSDARAAELAMAQALRRIAGFERRSGVPVARVMAPPHGACSEPALAAMFELGFDAACISRPRPWRDGLEPLTPQEGWAPAEIVAGGLPILPRLHLDGPREELVFRALLRQPLILYGHHWDLAQGLDVFAQAAEQVNALGDVRWGPLDEIAAQNHRSRQEGELLVVEMSSRRALVDVPAGARTAHVQLPGSVEAPRWRGLACGEQLVPIVRQEGGWCSQPVEVSPGGQAQLSLAPDAPLRAAALPRRAARPWPIARRVLVEGRDRLRPLRGS